MEKTIKWDQNEIPVMQSIDNERTQCLAQIGALMMELENAKKNLDTINGRQRSAVQQAISSRGIMQFESARPILGGVVLQVPEETGRINGGGD